MDRVDAAAAGDHVLHNLLVFARLLRSVGVAVSLEQVGDLAQIAQAVGMARRGDFYYASRAVFVRRRDDMPLFDRAFELFFSIQGQPSQAVVDPAQAPSRRILRWKPRGAAVERESERQREQQASTDRDPGGVDGRMVYSPLETLRQKDFGRFTPDEISTARRMIAAMNWSIGERKTRRRRPARDGTELDFSRLVRSNIKYGAEFLHLPQRMRQSKPRPLVVLADISGSMESYTRMVLHLLHALFQQGLANSATRMEVFVFGTRLTRITPKLRSRSVQDALTSVSRQVVDWSGGTRIGDALKTFNWKWARRVLRSGAVVLLISDGWDRGDLDLLAREMARLQRSCSRLIWLNPLSGRTSPDDIPSGLRAALPFVDDLLPVHNLISLETLAAKLATLDDHRPLRRQRPPAPQPEPAGETKHGFMELPQMGTSDYVRRTMVLRVVEGRPTIEYDENKG